MKELLKKYAIVAAGRFSQNSVSLNDSISKIAKENNLNIEQVKRLCEMANQLVQMEHYITDPLGQFELADSKKIIGGLNAPKEIVPVEDRIPTMPKSEAPLLTEYMRRFGPEPKEKPEVKITIIMIKRMEKAVNNEQQKLSMENRKLSKEAEQIDLNLRHMIKLAMHDGSYPALIKAAWETLETDGMRYVLQKIGFWKKAGIMYRDPKPVRGELNKEHPFVTGLLKLSQIKSRMKDIGVAQKRLKMIADKIVKVSRKPTAAISAKDITKSPTQTMFKGS